MKQKSKRRENEHTGKKGRVEHTNKHENRVEEAPARNEWRPAVVSTWPTIVAVFGRKKIELLGLSIEDANKKVCRHIDKLSQAWCLTDLSLGIEIDNPDVECGRLITGIIHQLNKLGLDGKSVYLSSFDRENRCYVRACCGAYESLDELDEDDFDWSVNTEVRIALELSYLEQRLDVLYPNYLFNNCPSVDNKEVRKNYKAIQHMAQRVSSKLSCVLGKTTSVEGDK